MTSSFTPFGRSDRVTHATIFFLIFWDWIFFFLIFFGCFFNFFFWIFFFFYRFFFFFFWNFIFFWNFYFRIFFIFFRSFCHQRIYSTTLGSRDIARWRFLWRGRRGEELGILGVRYTCITEVIPNCVKMCQNVSICYRQKSTHIRLNTVCGLQRPLAVTIENIMSRYQVFICW